MKQTNKSQAESILDTLFFGKANSIRLQVSKANNKTIKELQRYVGQIEWLRVTAIAGVGSKNKWCVISKAIEQEQMGEVIYVDFKAKKRIEKIAA